VIIYYLFYPDIYKHPTHTTLALLSFTKHVHTYNNVFSKYGRKHSKHVHTYKVFSKYERKHLEIFCNVCGVHLISINFPPKMRRHIMPNPQGWEGNHVYL
jgi:CRISPR/Cas system-associated protein Cas10 (large subunit of type III CRISPR-Cas system)